MSSFSIFSHSSSLTRGQQNKNTIKYINKYAVDSIIIDNEEGAFTEYSSSDGYFSKAVGINPDNESRAFYTLKTPLDLNGNTQDFSINYLSTENDFTIGFKYSVHETNTEVPLINIDLENLDVNDISFQILFSKDFVNAYNDSFIVTILKRSNDDISYNLSGNFGGSSITSADFDNIPINGDIKNYITQLTFNTTSSVGGNLNIVLSNSTHNFTSNSIFIIQTFFVKVVQTFLGNYVYAFSGSKNGTYINQKIIDLNPGTLIRFDTSDSSMLNRNLVFGTTEDDNNTIDNTISTINGNFGEENSYIILDLSSSTQRIEYFDSSNIDMGYIPGLDFKKFDFSMNDAFGNIINASINAAPSNSEVEFTVSGFNESFANGDYKLTVSGNDNNIGFPLLNVLLSTGIDFDWQINYGTQLILDEITVINSSGQSITYSNNAWIEINFPYSMDLKNVQVIGRQSSASSYPNNVEFYGSYDNEKYEFISSNTFQYNGAIGTTVIENNTKCFPTIVMIDTQKNRISINNISFSGDIFDRSHTNIYDVYKNNDKFTINNIDTPYFTLLPNSTYAFYQRDTTNIGNTLVFGTDHDNTNSIVPYQKLIGTSGNKGSYTEVTVSNEYLYVYSYEHTGITNKPPTIGVKKTTNIFGEDVFAFTEINGNIFYNQEYTPIIGNSYFVFKTNDSSLLDTSFNIVDITANNPLTFNDISNYNFDFSTIGTSTSTRVVDTLDISINELFITDISSSLFLGYRPYTKIDTTLSNYVVKIVTVSNNLFYIDDISQARLTFDNNDIFVFDQSHPSNVGNTLVVGIKPNDNQYRSNNITIMGEPGRTGAYTLFEGGINAFYYSFQNENFGQYVPTVKIKVQQNILGEDVFALTYDNGDVFYNQRVLPLESGATYIIDTSDNSMDGFEVNIFTAISTTSINDYIIKTGTIGQNDSFVSIFISQDYNNNTDLYYFNSYNNKLGYIPYTNVPNVSYSGGTEIYTVTSSNGKFFIDNQEIPDISFSNTKVHVFDQSHTSNQGNTLVISSIPNDSSNLFNNITVMGEPGQTGAYTLITANNTELYYFSFQNINYGFIPPINITLKISTNVIEQDVFYAQYVDNKQLYGNDNDFIIQRDLSFNSNNKYIIDTSHPSLLSLDLIYSFDRINANSLYNENNISVNNPIGTAGSVTTINLFGQTTTPFYLQLNNSSYNYNYVPISDTIQVGNIIQHTVTVSNNKFYIDGSFNVFFLLQTDTKYVFSQENNSNIGNTIILTTDIDNSSNMVSGINVHRKAGVDDSYTTFETGSTLQSQYLYYMSYENNNIGYEKIFYELKISADIVGNNTLLSKKSLGENSFIKQRQLNISSVNREIIYLDLSDPTLNGMEFVFTNTPIGVNGRYGSYMTNSTSSSVNKLFTFIEGTTNGILPGTNGSITTFDLTNYNSLENLYLYEKNNLAMSFEIYTNVIDNNSFYQEWINYKEFDGSKLGEEHVQISMSNDGSTVAIGGPNGDTNNKGNCIIMKYSSNNYYKTEIIGTNDNDNFGFSVDTSDDGNKIAISSPNTDKTLFFFSSPNAGKVVFYTFDSFTNTFIVDSFIESNTSNENIGKCVSLSSDGNTVAITSSVSTKIYSYSPPSGQNAGVWNQKGNTISNVLNVALSKDGNTLFTYSGDIYTYSNNTWNLSSSTINKNNIWTNTNEIFISLSISYDANTVAVGKKGSGTKPSYVEVYNYNSSLNSWNIFGQQLWPEFNDDNFGHSLSLSNDGLKLLVGSPNNQKANQNTDAGGMRVYHYITNSWVQYGLDINNPSNTNGNFGRAVSNNSDMSQIVTSSPYDVVSNTYYFKIPTIVNYNVTVVNGKFYLDNIQTPNITFQPNTKYIFNQSDTSNISNQIILTTVQNNVSNIINDIVIHKDPGTDNSYMYYITGNNVSSIYYMSYQTSNMGN